VIEYRFDEHSEGDTYDLGFDAAGVIDSDLMWMRRAVNQARLAAQADEVPVGAIIVRGGQILGQAHNGREQLRDPTAHAEMIAITQAASAIEDWRLEGCTMYVTLEPCAMCAGAILLARIPRVVFGASDPKGGAVHSLYQLLTDPRQNHRCEVVSGVLGPECGHLLTEFFAAKRAMGKK
jgi:tRNA(adenine34) deaminase